MSFALTYQGFISITGSLNCGTVDQSTNQVIINVDDGTNTYEQVYSAVYPYAQVGGNLGSSPFSDGTPTALTMLTSELLIGAGYSTHGGSYLNISTGATTAFPSLFSTLYSPQNQSMLAGQASTGIGIGCTNLQQTVFIFDSGGGIVYEQAIQGFQGDGSQFCTSVAPCPTNTNFIVALSGTANDPPMLLEIDGTATVQAMMALPIRNKSEMSAITSTTREVVCMASQYGYLIIETNIGEIILIDWITKRVMQRQSKAPTTAGLLMFGQESITSNLLFMGLNKSSINNYSLLNYDWCRTPMLEQTLAGNLGIASCTAVGLLAGINTVVVIDSADAKVHFLTYTGARAITLDSAAINISGVPQAGDYLILDNTVTPAELIFATPMPAGVTRQVPFTTGLSSVLVCGKTGEGEGTSFMLSEFST